MSADVSIKKSFCRKDLAKRWHITDRTLRRMRKQGHRHYLPKPDMGDRWSEDLIRDTEREWRGKLLAPASSDNIFRISQRLMEAIDQRFQGDSMSAVVELSEPEMLIGGLEAVIRRTKNVIKASQRASGAQHMYGATDDDVKELNSTWAEMAVARHFNLYWTGIIEMNRIDVGDMIEVRSASRDTDSLILHDNDVDDLPYVLVLARPPRFKLVGWKLGRDGKQDKYWRVDGVRHPAYFVPQSHLLSIGAIEFLYSANREVA